MLAVAVLTVHSVALCCSRDLETSDTKHYSYDDKKRHVFAFVYLR